VHRRARAAHQVVSLIAQRCLDLVELAAQAARAATQLAEVRFGEDPDKELILERVRDAAKEDMTRRLMRTPLQMTIMSG
jgi:hypothetical protein